jgi:hypothetical protein
VLFTKKKALTWAKVASSNIAIFERPKENVFGLRFFHLLGKLVTARTVASIGMSGGHHEFHQVGAENRVHNGKKKIAVQIEKVEFLF